MIDIINRLLCKQSGLSYLIFDDNFTIVSFDENIQELVDDIEFLKVGSDIRECFWAITGMEDELLHQGTILTIPMIYKSKGYYDARIEEVELREDMRTFMIFISTKSDLSLEYVNTLKGHNQETLIMQTQEIQLNKEKNYYDLINQNTLSFHVDIEGIITEVNSMCAYFLGLEEHAIIGQHFSKYFQTRELSLTQAKGKIFNAFNSQGKEVFFHAEIIPIKQNDTIYENIILCQDITHLKQVQRELEYAANHDSLTGLPNRSHLLKKIDEFILECDDTKSFSLCFIDLNKFKPINDTYGHHAGDMLLRHTAKLLSNFVRDLDVVARIGGDEFIILFHHMQHQDYLLDAMHRINSLAEQNPLVYNEEDTIHFNFSIGMSIYPKDAKNAKELLDFADKQMYKMKRKS